MLSKSSEAFSKVIVTHWAALLFFSNLVSVVIFCSHPFTNIFCPENDVFWEKKISRGQRLLLLPLLILLQLQISSICEFSIGSAILQSSQLVPSFNHLTSRKFKFMGTNFNNDRSIQENCWVLLTFWGFVLVCFLWICGKTLGETFGEKKTEKINELQMLKKKSISRKLRFKLLYCLRTP